MVQSRLSELVHVDHIFHGEYGLSRLHLFLFNIQADIAANHQAGDLLFIKIGDLVCSHGLSVPEDRHTVAECLDFV